MATRALMLPAILVVLAVAGCSSPNDQPQAPEPRPKGEKTKAELLIGTWKLVSRTPPPNPFVPMTFEYTKDGKVTLLKNNPLEKGTEIQTGTYRVEGDILFRTMDTEPSDRNVTIESITENKLTTSGLSGSTRMVHEYERVKGENVPQ